MRGAALVDEVTLFNEEEGSAVTVSIFGDPEPVELAGVTVPAFVSPLDATEIEINREVRLARYSVMLDLDAPITGISELEWEGERYRVIGEPKRYTSHRGGDHVEVEIRRAEG